MEQQDLLSTKTHKDYVPKLQFEEVFSVWKLFKNSHLYHVLNDGEYTIWDSDKVDSVFALIDDAVKVPLGTEYVWGVSKDLEDDFKNRREIYCLVGGLAYLCNVLYQNKVLTSEVIHEVIIEHLKTSTLQNSEDLHSLDGVRELVSKFIVLKKK